MDPTMGIGLLCSGLCCVLAGVLMTVAIVSLLRRGKDEPAAAPSAAPGALSDGPAASAVGFRPAASASIEDDGSDAVDEGDIDEPTTLMPMGQIPKASSAVSRPSPPPLPGAPVARQSGPPPAARSHKLDPASMPDIPTLRPGATIIPPDDWDDDYIDEADVDETMLMPRAKLGLDE